MKQAIKHLITVAACISAFLTVPATHAQAVIFPQQRQAGTASVTTHDKTITLSNNLLSASFVNDNGRLSFGGCSELGLEPGTELFTITLQNDTTASIPASAMTVTGWGHESLSA